MKEYFKPRDRFDFSSDTLDIGNALSWKQSHFLKHFFKRVFAIREDRLEAFYRHHLAYYLANHADGSEEQFFKTLWELIERQLKVLLNKDVYDRNHVRNQREIDRLQKFTGVLIPLDQWNFHKSNDAVIAQQESEIYLLKQQAQQLKSELKAARKLETEDYINISKDQLLTFLDLCLQLQEARLPDGRELLFSQTQIVWVKMVCRYFRADNEEISSDTVRRFFRAISGTPVPNMPPYLQKRNCSASLKPKSGADIFLFAKPIQPTLSVRYQSDIQQLIAFHNLIQTPPF